MGEMTELVVMIMKRIAATVIWLMGDRKVSRMVRPVNQATLVIPLVHAAKSHTIAEPDGHAFREIKIVSEQYCLAIAEINNKALMTRAFAAVTQQASHEA